LYIATNYKTIDMRAEELRIGNLVYTETIDDPYRIETVYELSTLSINESYIILNIPPYQPIPLTEEWLLKFGWDKLELVDRTIGYNKYALFIGYRNHNLRLMGSNIHIINIKYVHQLQNIFYALTNEELILKQ
jgi:hypothetical protein